MKPIPERAKVVINSKTSLVKIVALVLFVLAWVNPYTEKMNGESALVFMFSHYSLCLAGLLLGISYFKWPAWLWVPGVAFLSLWHLPIFFALSGNSFAYRVPEEAMIFLGGLFIGSNFKSMNPATRIYLFVAYIIADSVLSAFFIIAPKIYSSISISPFGSGQFVITGVAMVIFMTWAISYVTVIFWRATVKRLNGPVQ